MFNRSFIDFSSSKNYMTISKQAIANFKRSSSESFGASLAYLIRTHSSRDYR